MQLNITTDYAIRVVLYLGQCQEKVSSTQIAQDMCIPKGYLEKVLSALKKASYISADLGTKGGYYLKKGLEDFPGRTVRYGDTVKSTDVWSRRILPWEDC